MLASDLYIVENLNWIVWVSSVLPRQFLDRFRKEGHTAWYFIDGSPLAVATGKIASRLLRTDLQRFTFRLIDIRDENGSLIEERLRFEDLFVAQEKTLAHPAWRRLRISPSASYLNTFLKKGIANLIRRKVLLVQLAAWQMRKQAAERAILLTGRQPWLEAVRQYASDYHVQVLPAFPRLTFESLILGLFSGRTVAIGVYLRDKLVRFRTHKFSAVPPEMTSNPKIAVQHYGHLNLDRPELYSDLFFWQNSSLGGRDMLVFFEIAHDPLNEAKLAELAKHGMNSVALRPQASTLRETLPFEYRPRLRGPEGDVFLSGGRADAESGWLMQQCSSYFAVREYWRQFFLVNSIKLYVVWYRLHEKQAAVNDALRSVGGISAIYERSVELHASPLQAAAVDIAFGFGRYGGEVHRRSGSDILYYVTTGYLGDHRISLLRGLAQDLKRDLRKNGGEYIISFFDENSGDDSRWHTGHQLQRDNYAFLLEKLLDDPTLGVVFKPKVPKTLRRRLGPVAELLARAEATGRCYVFTGGALQGSYPPAAAALASDLAIHGHLSSGTAGLEASLAGIPTLLVDREGWPQSPFYRLGRGRVAFTQWDELWNAVVEHRKKPGNVAGFGDWSPMLNELDPFRDGRAANRMGTYIQWLLEALRAGVNRENAMADAAERYCKAWGHDKVVQFCSKTNHLHYAGSLHEQGDD